jgi:hypothetical protein
MKYQLLVERGDSETVATRTLKLVGDSDLGANLGRARPVLKLRRRDSAGDQNVAELINGYGI